jgi:hypothetical protein
MRFDVYFQLKKIRKLGSLLVFFSAIVGLLNACSTSNMHINRELASRENCVDLVHLFFLKETSSFGSSFNFEAKREALRKKIEQSYTDYMERLYSNSSDRQRPLFKKTLNEISSIRPNKSNQDALVENPILLKIGVRSDLMGTEVGMIRIVHELEHIKNISGSGSIIERFKWLAEAVYKKNSIAIEETSAFSAEREFILNSHDFKDLEIIRSLKGYLDNLNTLCKEEILIRDRKVSKRLKMSAADDVPYLRQKLSTLSSEELQLLYSETQNLQIYYYDYGNLIEAALTKNYDDYIETSLAPYQNKIRLQNTLRYSIPAGAGVAGFTITQLNSLEDSK